MSKLSILCLLTVSAFAQNESLGAFTNAGDVGDTSRKGSTEFDASNGQYRISGSGANIWAKQDGNFAITASMQFLGEGEAHRKAGIMFRQSLDADSPYADIVIHGNGMPGIQWRSNKGESTNTLDLPFDGPGKFKLKLVRNGVRIFVSIAKDSGELKEIAHTEVTLRNPILAGLAVCSHKADASDTVVFSDVTVERLAPSSGKKQ